jgi:hypothetical protein
MVGDLLCEEKFDILGVPFFRQPYILAGYGTYSGD